MTTAWTKLSSLVSEKDLKIIEDTAYIDNYKSRTLESEQEIKKINEHLEDIKCKNKVLQQNVTLLKDLYEKDLEAIPLHSQMCRRLKERLQDSKKNKDDREKYLKDLYQSAQVEYENISAELQEFIPESKLYNEKALQLINHGINEKILKQRISDIKAKIKLKIEVQQGQFNATIVNFVSNVRNFGVIKEIEVLTAAGNELLKAYEQKLLENDKRDTRCDLFTNQLLKIPKVNFTCSDSTTKSSNAANTMKFYTYPHPSVDEKKTESFQEIQKFMAGLSSCDKRFNDISLSNLNNNKMKAKMIIKQDKVAPEIDKKIVIMDQIVLNKSKKIKNTQTYNPYKSNETKTIPQEEKNSYQSRNKFINKESNKIINTEFDTQGGKNARFNESHEVVKKINSKTVDNSVPRPDANLKRTFEMKTVDNLSKKFRPDPPKDSINSNKEFLDSRKTKILSQPTFNQKWKNNPTPLNQGFGSSFSQPIQTANRSSLDNSTLYSPFFQENNKNENKILKDDNNMKDIFANPGELQNKKNAVFKVPPPHDTSIELGFTQGDESWNINLSQDCQSFKENEQFGGMPICLSPPPEQQSDDRDSPFNKFGPSFDKNYCSGNNFFFGN